MGGERKNMSDRPINIIVRTRDLRKPLEVVVAMTDVDKGPIKLLVRQKNVRRKDGSGEERHISVTVEDASGKEMELLGTVVERDPNEERLYEVFINGRLYLHTLRRDAD